MKILVLDNYDSFTYNLVQYLEEIPNCKVDVFRNNEISLKEVEKYDKIVLSPGPGIPDEAGIMKQLIEEYADKKPIFGVCLGLQAIAEVFGGKIKNMNKVYHGIATTMEVKIEKEILFKDIPKKFKAGRYHSWLVENKGLPNILQITVEDEESNIMALSHKKFNVKGVQFHPESILTKHGRKIIENFIIH